MSQTHSLRPGSIYVSFINSVWLLLIPFVVRYDYSDGFQILFPSTFYWHLKWALCLYIVLGWLGMFTIQTPNKALYTCVRVFESTCTKSPLNCSYQWQIYDTIPSNLSKGQDSIYSWDYTYRGLDPNQVISTTICVQNNL